MWALFHDYFALAAAFVAPERNSAKRGGRGRRGEERKGGEGRKGEDKQIFKTRKVGRIVLDLGLSKHAGEDLLADKLDTLAIATRTLLDVAITGSPRAAAVVAENTFLYSELKQGDTER